MLSRGTKSIQQRSLSIQRIFLSVSSRSAVDELTSKFTAFSGGNSYEFLSNGSVVGRSNSAASAYWSGTYSLTNSILSGKFRSYDTSGNEVENSVTMAATLPSEYSNVDSDAYAAYFGSDVEKTVPAVVKEDAWLLYSSTDRFLMYKKIIEETYFSDTSLHVDPNEPVLTSDPIYAIRTYFVYPSEEQFDDGTAIRTAEIPFLASEVEGSWALPGDLEADERDTNDLISPDIGTFNADGTGSMNISGQTFQWSIGSLGELRSSSMGATILSASQNMRIKVTIFQFSPMQTPAASLTQSSLMRRKFKQSHRIQWNC